MNPRLEPVERPRGLLLRAAYWLSKRRLGKVMMPLKVAYSRAPAIGRASFSLAQAVEKKLSLDPGLRLLVQAQASQLNGCGFCLDLKHAMAVQNGIGLEKLEALAEYRESPLFSDRERAALDYAGEATRSRRVSDAAFANLRKHFSEREIVELTFANAVENFHNLIGIPLGIESDGLCAIAQARGRRPG
jgi:AhpD family alkylhydroperoxidase